MSTKDQWQGPMGQVSSRPAAELPTASYTPANHYPGIPIRRCEGHRDHRFEPLDCLVCGHTLDEHPDGQWVDDR